MKLSKKLSLQEEIDKEAQEIEREITEDPTLKDVQAPKSLDEKLFEQIRDYEEEKKKSNSGLRSGGPAKKKLFILLAAVLILALGTSLSAIGNKSFVKKIWENIVGKQTVTNIDVDDMPTHKTEDQEALATYQEIEEQTGIGAVRWGYRPKGMKLTDVQIFPEEKMARLFYEYEDEIITYAMYLNDEESSYAKGDEDWKIKENKQVVNGLTVTLREYLVDDLGLPRYDVLFESKGVHYILRGVIEKGEIDKIVENLQII